MKKLIIVLSVLKSDCRRIPNMKAANWSHDVVFVANGTTSGVRILD
jgi:phosphoserine aminotransferase